MYSRDGSIRANGVFLRFVEKSGAAVFVAGSLLFFSALTLHQIGSSPSVTLDLGQWDWLSGIQLSLEQDGPVSKTAEVLASLAAEPLVLKSAPVSLASGHRSEPLVRHTRVAIKNREKPIQVVYAHPVPAAAEIPTLATEKELLDIQAIHRLLRARFTVALNDSVAPEAQVAQTSVNIQPEMPRQNARIIRKKVPATIIMKTGESVVALNPVRPERKTLVSVKEPLSITPAPVKITGSKASLDHTSSSLSRPIVSPDLASLAAAPPQKAQVIPLQPAILAAPSFQAAPEPPKETAAGVQQAESATEQAQVLMALAKKAGLIAKNDYPAPSEYSPPAANTQPKESNTHSPAKASPHPSDILNAWTGNEEIDQPGFLKPEFVEAFDGAEVAEAYSEQFSIEGQYQRGWMKAQAAQHWSTLYWNNGASSLPLISVNSARLMAAKSGVALQEGAGIVFGRVAAGWRVEFSGRAEAPYFFDSQNQLVSASQSGNQTDGERTFVFVNAAPGAQLVYAINTNGDQVGAIATPVLAGSSTYLDLTEASSVSLTGVVFDGQSDRSRGIANAQVSVIGQPKAFVTTDARGVFAMEHITQLGHYPLYLDTNRGKEYTHRYRVIMGDRKEKNVALVRLSDQQITDTLGQLQGGISPESGIVAAAVPGLISRVMDPALTPSVTSLVANPSLVPETYTLSATGQLAVQEPLRAGFQRFVSVQIPEGPALVQTVGKQKTPLWSELLFISRGVVNVVGPVN